MLIEKGLDNFGKAAVAQGDIDRYFDSLAILRVLIWLRDRGVGMALLAAIARHQLLTIIFVSRRGLEVTLSPRAKGGLTGSTLAMMLARIPVEASCVNLYPSCALRGFPVVKCRLVFGAWVDNIYCVRGQPSR